MSAALNDRSTRVAAVNRTRATTFCPVLPGWLMSGSLGRTARRLPCPCSRPLSVLKLAWGAGIELKGMTIWREGTTAGSRGGDGVNGCRCMIAFIELSSRVRPVYQRKREAGRQRRLE
jgi:hypothetical protein